MDKKPQNSAGGLRLNYKIWMTNQSGEASLGDGRIELLKEIRERKSIMAAANTLGISYRKAWGDIKKAEECLGFPIVDKKRGGELGGTTVLTTGGEVIIAAWEKMHVIFRESLKQAAGDFASSFTSE